MSGRVESLITVPSGVTISVSNGAVSSPVTVTIPAGTYYHTAAGGVDSLGETIETAINETYGPQGYPQSLSALASAIGVGNLAAATGGGWLFNISSGSDAGAFGGVTMTAAGTPVYGTAGPRGGIDLAIAFDSALDGFAAGDNFDAGAADDMVIVWVGKNTASPAGNRTWFEKFSTTGFYSYRAADALIRFSVYDGVDTATASCTQLLGEWHVGIMVLDRTAAVVRVGLHGLTSGTQSVGSTASSTAVGALSNIGSFLVGAGTVAGVGDTDMPIAALYVGVGSGIATGLSAGLSTALTNFAGAVGSSFTVSLDTTSSTGRVTISNSWWPSYVQFTSTDARDVLGFAYDFDYPQTAAQVLAALGVGGGYVTAGYLCNETSGSLAPVFGLPASASATNTPTYSNAGARGGGDKAVGFDGANDAFNFGDSFDIGAADDLLVVWVGKWSAAAARDICGKYSGGVGWGIWHQAGTTPQFYVDDTGANNATASIGTILLNEWYVGIAALDRTAGTIRMATKGLTSGTTTVSSNVSASSVGDCSNAADAVLGAHAGIFNDGSGHQVSAFYIGTGVGYANGIPGNMAAAISNFAAYMKSQTGTEQAEGIWFPDCPISLDGDPTQAPRVSDLRTTMSPTGAVFGLSGNVRFEHTGIVWSHVDRERVWESAATYANASWESFFVTTQMGMGHAWFTPASPIQIWWENAGTTVLLGADYNGGTGLSGWNIVNVASVAVPKAISTWTGLFRVELPKIVSAG
jgi:hypothetical protein